MIALLLLGCTQTVRFPPNLWVWETGLWDTGVDPVAPGGRGALDPATLESGCVADGGALHASVRTLGWAGSATLELLTPTRDETHPMWLVDSDPDGAWDAWRVGPMPTGVDPLDQQPATTTALACDAALAWVLWTTDRLGAPVDCLAWGADVDAAVERVRARPELAELTCRPLPAP